MPLLWVIATAAITALILCMVFVEPRMKAEAQAWCEPRGLEVYREDRAGYRCRDPRSGAVYIPEPAPKVP